MFCRRALPILLAACIFAGGALSAKYDPDLTWKTLETEHFYIHFHNGEEKLAQKYAMLAEKKYPVMVKKLGHTPYFRTHLVVSDVYDDPNGTTMQYPWSRVELFAAKPLPGSTLGNYSDWNDLLFTHEYTHVLNLDQIRGLPAISRYVLGRYIFPNEWQPLWLIEGSAVMEESADGHGRNNSPVVEMYFRSAVEGDDLKSLNRSSNYVRDFPSGEIYYFYGGRFVQWLKKKYPDKEIHAVHAENADNVWPFLNNTNARDVFGAAFTDLWEEWQAELTKEQQSRIADVRKSGLTPLTRLTEADFYQTFPRFDASGKVLYYLNENNYTRPTLNRIRILGKKGATKGRELNAPAFLTMHKGEPYVLDNELYRSFSLHYDVFSTTEAGQLTEKLRAVSLDFTPKEEILAITQNAGDYTLALYDKKGKHIRTLLGPTTTTLSHARLSSDGKQVVFCAMESMVAATHLYLLNPENGEMQQLTEGRFTDLHPAFSADGSKVVFSSDRSGIFNLHELTLASGELARLTNLTGGAFYPDVAPDGKSVALSEFTHKGYRIALLERNQPELDKQTLAFKKISANDLMAAHASPAAIATKDYSVFPSILPSAWFPWVMFYSNAPKLASLGVSVYGLDALQRDFIGVGYSRGINSGNNNADLFFETQRFYPDFYISPYVTVGEICNGLCYAGFNAGMVLPFYKYYTRHTGYASTYYDYDRYYGATDNSLTLGYSFSNTQFFARSVSPENGRSLGASATLRRYAETSSYAAYAGTFSNLAFSYTEYLPGFFRNNVLAARAYVAQSLDIGSGNLGYSDASRYAVFGWGTRVRGYGNSFVGTGLTVLSLEYRFPIYQPDWGFFRVPVFFKDFYGKVFADAGQSYSGLPEFSRTRTSAGAEVGLSSVFGYRYYWSAFAGYARGFNEGGEHQIYFGILGYTSVLTAKYSPHAEHR